MIHNASKLPAFNIFKPQISPGSDLRSYLHPAPHYPEQQLRRLLPPAKVTTSSAMGLQITVNHKTGVAQVTNGNKVVIKDWQLEDWKRFQQCRE